MANGVIDTVNIMIEALNNLPTVNISTIHNVEFGARARADADMLNAIRNAEMMARAAETDATRKMREYNREAREALARDNREARQEQIAYLRATETAKGYLNDIFGTPGYGRGLLDGSDEFSNYTVSTPGGAALRVAQQGPIEIRGEMIRLMEDVVRHRYISGTYRQAAPVTQITQNIYATQGMNEEQLAKKAGYYACEFVADQMRKSYGYDLRSKGAVLV